MMAFIVLLQGGSPWGFRLTGGKEYDEPVRIAKVNPGSKAAKADILAGDEVYSINGQSTDDLELNDAINLIKSSTDIIELHIRRKTSPGSSYTRKTSFSTSNGPVEEDMTETSTRTMRMNSDPGVRTGESLITAHDFSDVDLQNLPGNVALVKKTTTKVTKITRCTSPARWSSSESLTSYDGERKRDHTRTPPISVPERTIYHIPEVTSGYILTPPLGREVSPDSSTTTTTTTTTINRNLQVPESPTSKSEVTKLLREIDSRPPHRVPRHNGPGLKSMAASPPSRRKKVKTTLTIRPRSNSFDGTVGRALQPVNFKPVSKDDNLRTLTSPPPVIPPPPECDEYSPVFTLLPQKVKTMIMMQPEANRPKRSDPGVSHSPVRSPVRQTARQERRSPTSPRKDLSDECAVVAKINPAAVPHNTYQDPSAPPVFKPTSPSHQLAMMNDIGDAAMPKLNPAPKPKPGEGIIDDPHGVWSPGQPPPEITREKDEKERDANFNIPHVWKPFGGDAPKKEYKPIKIELNGKPKSKDSPDAEEDVPPTPPPPPAPTESFAWRSPPPPPEEEKSKPVFDYQKPSDPESVQNKGPSQNGDMHLPPTVSPTITLLQHNRERRLREAQSPPPPLLSPPLSPKPKLETKWQTLEPTTRSLHSSSTSSSPTTSPTRRKIEPVKTATLTVDRLPAESPNVHVITDPLDNVKQAIRTHEIEGETVLKDKVIYAAPNVQVISDPSQLPPGAVYQTKTVEGDVIHTDTYYPVKVPGSMETTKRVVRQSGKYDGIGPVDKESGMPIGLRSGVKEDKRHDWYKEMYKSIHRQDKKDDEDNKYMRFVREGVILDDNPYMPTYLFPEDTEPPKKEEPPNPYRPSYDTTDITKRKEEIIAEKERAVSPNRKTGQQWQIPSARNTIERYSQQPRSITDYEPGKSSLAAKEKSSTAHMYNPPLEKIEPAKAPIAYSSGSQTLPASFRRGGDQLSPRHRQQQPLSPQPIVNRVQSPPPVGTQHDLYKDIQKGGEIPTYGLRQTEEQLASPTDRYSASDIHNYRGPVSPLSPSSNVQKERILEEERQRRKEAEKEQEKWRRHSDYSPMKSQIITNDRFEDPAELARQRELQKKRAQEVKTPARALYPFTAQNAKELSFKKGDVIYITRQIDKNWLEGEHHGRVGIFPSNYVEAMPNTEPLSPKLAANEGKAKAKYSFTGETNLELSLKKGDTVILVRRVDSNWYEGKVGEKQGIFPASYVDVLQEPTTPAHKNVGGSGYLSPQLSPAVRSPPPVVQSPPPPMQPQQPTSPRHAQQAPPPPQVQRPREAPGPYQQPYQHQQPPPPHQYSQTLPSQRPSSQPSPQQHQYYQSNTIGHPPVQEHFRAIYPYSPHNEDELELLEGDVVVVMEKCDDGWFVGTSTRTGHFGTFPGNYVERM